MAKYVLMIAAISGFLAVTLGAFGAHGLKGRVEEDLLTVYHTGVEYHFYHTMALLAVGVLLLQFTQSNLLIWSGWLFLFGIVVFSGSLYVMTFTGLRWLGAITPIGGVGFLVAWVLLALAIFREV